MHWIKTYGAELSDLRFFKLPKVIERARETVADPDVVGYLLCALELPPKMTGLLFCDYARDFPEGLPIHTKPIVRRYTKAGYEIVIAVDGGVYVVAHWLYNNGSLDRFDRIH